jgi:hypothetical protein
MVMTEKISVTHYFDKRPDESFPKAIFGTVYECMTSLGYEVPSHEAYTVPDGADELREDAGILPEFMTGADNDIPDLIRTGILFPFDLESTLEEQFNQEGSEPHATSGFINRSLSVRDAVSELDRRMKIELAIENVKESVDQNTSHPASEIVAYALATYAKGWLVESVLAESDRFSKGERPDDAEGKDLFDTLKDEWVQLKSVTSMAGKSRAKLDAHSVSYLYYQFDCAGHIVIGDDPNEVNSVAADTKGVSKTLIKRTHSTYKFEGRTYRYLWW